MERPTVNDTPLSEQEKRVTPSALLTVNQRRNAQRMMKRQNETAEERSNRLQAERERMASTSHERNKRRRLKRQSETNEQRAERLADERERWYNRRQEQNQRRRSRRKSDSNKKRAVRRMHDREQNIGQLEAKSKTRCAGGSVYGRINGIRNCGSGTSFNGRRINNKQNFVQHMWWNTSTQRTTNGYSRN